MNFPGDPGCTNSALATTHYNEFGPRLGFAWAPDLGWISGAPGKFSIRGGFGIYYDRTEEEPRSQTLGTPPFGLTSGGALRLPGKPLFVNPYADINGGESSRSAAGRWTSYRSLAAEPFPLHPAQARSSSGPVRTDLSTSTASTRPSALPTRRTSSSPSNVSFRRRSSRASATSVRWVVTTRRLTKATRNTAGHAACLADSGLRRPADDLHQASDYPSHTIGHCSTCSRRARPAPTVRPTTTRSRSSITKAPTHGLLFQLSYTYCACLG